MTYSEGIEDGLKIAVDKINEELGTDFASLGIILQHLWKVKMEVRYPNLSNTTKFKETFCSQCGEEFGPGDSGYSSCKSHSEKTALHLARLVCADQPPHLHELANKLEDDEKLQ